MPKEKFIIPKTDCGAIPKIDFLQLSAFAQTEVPAKGPLCGGCTYRRRLFSKKFIGPIETDNNRNCWEGLAPTPRKAHS